MMSICCRLCGLRRFLLWVERRGVICTSLWSLGDDSGCWWIIKPRVISVLGSLLMSLCLLATERHVATVITLIPTSVLLLHMIFQVAIQAEHLGAMWAANHLLTVFRSMQLFVCEVGVVLGKNLATIPSWAPPVDPFAVNTLMLPQFRWVGVGELAFWIKITDLSMHHIVHRGMVSPQTSRVGVLL